MAEEKSYSDHKVELVGSVWRNLSHRASVPIPLARLCSTMRVIRSVTPCERSLCSSRKCASDLISRREGVEFCGYSVPHPVEAKMHLRIQTKGETRGQS